jgi:hypothetical protein
MLSKLSLSGMMVSLNACEGMRRLMEAGREMDREPGAGRRGRASLGRTRVKEKYFR